VKFFKALGRKGLLWIYRKCESARFDGIALVDWDETPHFVTIVTAALKVIKENDPRRFHRVQREIRFVVNCTRPFGGGAYFSDTKACEFEFEALRSDEEIQFYTYWYACALVHEATHGRLQSCGIPYTPDNRARIEKLCVTEERRFARRLTLPPRVSAWLQESQVFDPQKWERNWNTRRWKKFVLTMRRVGKRSREQSANDNTQENPFSFV
jgi:hypothetical protein